MEVWQIWGLAGVALVILEMFTPAMFFLNLAIAAIITGVSVYYTGISTMWQVVVFAASSVILLAFLRPLLLKAKDEPEKTGVKAAYYGQSAKVTEKITKDSGRISIFGEAWDARTQSGAEVEVGEFVKILYCKNLTMIVEKI